MLTKIRFIFITLVFVFLTFSGWAYNESQKSQEQPGITEKKYDFNLFKLFSFDIPPPVIKDTIKSASFPIKVNRRKND